MMLDEIYKNLGGASGPYCGVSYDLTENNNYELLSTPNLWGHDPTKIDYVPAAKNLTGGIEELIASAKFTVDISTMAGSPTSKEQPPFPDGDFLVALRNGLQRAAKNGNQLVIRVLFGLPPYIVIVASRMEKWMESLDLPPQFPVYVGAMASKAPESFNHAKLVVVDGLRAIGGGHNLWQQSYCEVAPVHDVSVLVSGPANMVAQRFLNLQWNTMARTSMGAGGPVSFLHIGGKSYPNALPLIQRTPPSDKLGNTRILSVARLGRGLIDSPHDANASRNARLEAVRLATQSIKLSQQMLGGKIVGPYDEQFIAAVASAVTRGVNVDVVISDPDTRTGYSGFGIEDTAKKLFEAIAKVSGKHGAELVSLCTKQVHIAVLRFCDKSAGAPPDYWKWQYQNGKRQSPANHAKVYIVDDSLFYVGSDNAYSPDSAFPNPEGFQEFGYIISGQEETKRFIENYWAKLWSYSGPYQFSDWTKFLGKSD
jgi:phosphatidylserine/phosphatidylglycerophosphate/cardiolipin synthase-like enzyme